MAKAEFVSTPKPDVKLTLTHDEAQTLADVMAAVGGSPDRSRRKYTQAILDALNNLGIKYQYPVKPDFSGSSLHFKDSF